MCEESGGVVRAPPLLFFSLLALSPARGVMFIAANSFYKYACAPGVGGSNPHAPTILFNLINLFDLQR
jgi:hypothetical protein